MPSSHYNLVEWVKLRIGKGPFLSLNPWESKTNSRIIPNGLSVLSTALHIQRIMSTNCELVFFFPRCILFPTRKGIVTNTWEYGARRGHQERKRWTSSLEVVKLSLRREGTLPSLPYILVARAGSPDYFVSVAKSPPGQGKWVPMSSLDNVWGHGMTTGELTTILDTLSGNFDSQTSCSLV